jgi:iron complex transport system substrate-binding protein
MVMRSISARPSFFLLGLTACCLFFGNAGHGADDVVTDAPSRAVPTADASRIVSIGGSITEILYALGLQRRIVAVDTTSLYPPSALQEKPNVGYMRQLSAEGVLALSPSLVLALEGSGPKETIEILERSKIPFVVVPDKFSGDGIVDKIRVIARSVDAAERGECLVRRVQNDLAALDGVRARIRRRVKVAFILSLANDRPMVSGRATAADGIIGMAGANNAFQDFDGYKLVNDEAIIAAKPEAVLAMQRGEHALSAQTVFAQPALAMTPAAERKAFVSMDGLYLLGFGPRTAQAARDLAERLYADIGAGKLSSEKAASASRCDQ